MKNAILFIIIILMVGCLKPKANKSSFNNNEVSFSCPTGWSITEEDSLDGNGYYISCEKTGLNSSGLVTITWVNDSIDLDEQLIMYQESFKNNIIYKKSNLLFDSITDNKFNLFKTRACKYTMRLLTLEHEGIMHSFYKNGKTFYILKQGALEDSKINNDGFNIIENSIVIK